MGALASLVLAFSAVCATPVFAQAVSVEEARRISASASQPARAEARKAFAEAFTQLQDNRFPAAIEHFVRGLALDPANASARYFYGLALGGMGNRAAARAQYEMILRLEPQSEVGNIARGILLEFDEKVSDTIEGCW
jgi:Flp pilus assembly protein TadD